MSICACLCARMLCVRMRVRVCVCMCVCVNACVIPLPSLFKKVAVRNSEKAVTSIVYMSIGRM